MLYNAPDTVYYRQAHSIQEIAKRDFENLRHEGDNGQPQPKVVRRGRPPSNRNLKTSPLNRVGADPSSGGTLTNTEDKGTGSNPYNLRKGPELFRYRPNDPYVSSYRPRNSDYHSELSGDWNNEFPATILRADMKSSKKQIVIDENRRDTYRQFGPLSLNSNSSAFTNSAGDMNQLGMVGLHEPLAYARSLARFAKDLGPVAWKVASKKLDYVLPPGTEYGPGWVADEGASSSQPPSFPNTPAVDSELSSSPTYGLSAEMVEAVRRLNSQNEQGLQGNVSPWKTPFPQVQQGGNISPWKTPLPTVQQGNVSPWKTPFPPVQQGSDASPWKTPFPPVQQNQFYQLRTQPQPQRNGFGYNQQTSRLAMEGFHFPPQAINPMPQQMAPAFSGFQFPTQTINPMPAAFPQQEGGMWTNGRTSWPALQGQHGRSLAAAPDLNLRIPAGSPSSSLQIGSPQQYQKQKQPDLALQL